MRKLLPTTVFPALLALVLAACGTPTPPAEPEPEPDLEAAYYEFEGFELPVALAAAVGVYDPGAITITRVPGSTAPEALVDVGNGWLLGPLFSIGEDGSVGIDLPEADAELAAALVPADEALMSNDPVTCPLTVSDPAVEVTMLGFELITAPGVVLLTAEGMIPGVLSAEEITSTDSAELASHTFYGFAYASGPVTIVGTGAGCVDDGSTADLDLEAGWNWLAWTVVLDEGDAFSHTHVTDVEAPDDLKLGMLPIL